jgi:hypothetical protein
MTFFVWYWRTQWKNGFNCDQWLVVLEFKTKNVTKEKYKCSFNMVKGARDAISLCENCCMTIYWDYSLYNRSWKDFQNCKYHGKLQRPRLGVENFEKLVNIVKNWSSDTHVNCASPSARLFLTWRKYWWSSTYWGGGLWCLQKARPLIKRNKPLGV